MRARDIIGKKVTKVVQVRTTDTSDTVVYDVEALVFEDGTYLHFSVAELHGEYAVIGTILKEE